MICALQNGQILRKKGNEVMVAERTCKISEIRKRLFDRSSEKLGSARTGESGKLGLLSSLGLARSLPVALCSCAGAV